MSRRPLRSHLKVRFTLRTLFALMLLCGICLGLYTDRVVRQRSAVAAIVRDGGRVWYRLSDASLISPALQGSEDWFYPVMGVILTGAACNDRTARQVLDLPAVEHLALEARPLGGVLAAFDEPQGVTDRGLAVVRSLPNLRSISLSGNRFTDVGFEHLMATPRLIKVTTHPDECPGVSWDAFQRLMRHVNDRRADSYTKEKKRRMTRLPG